jgi:hypothetical protein
VLFDALDQVNSSKPRPKPEFVALSVLRPVISRVGANPYSESLDEFLERARRHYHARTSLLMAMGSKEATTRNGHAVAERRSRRAAGKPSLANHCLWFALHRVEGLRIAEIARRVWQERTTVSKAVHAIAKLLQVPLPSPRRRSTES